MKPSIRRSLLVLALGAGTLTSSAFAEEVRTSQTRPNRSMMSSGVVALGIPYVASVVVAAESKHPGDHDLYVPVAGPWMDLGRRQCPGGAPSCNNEGLYKGLLVVDGIFQGIGALEIAGAFLFPETVTITGSRSGTKQASATSTPAFRIAPTVGGTAGYGLVALGAF